MELSKLNKANDLQARISYWRKREDELETIKNENISSTIRLTTSSPHQYVIVLNDILLEKDIVDQALAEVSRRIDALEKEFEEL